MSEAMKSIDKYKRNLMKGMLRQCTDEQNEMFKKMYISVEEIKEKDIMNAFDQIERTIKKNALDMTLNALKEELLEGGVDPDKAQKEVDNIKHIFDNDINIHDLVVQSNKEK